MSTFRLTAEEIQTNYLTFRKIINERFPTRKAQLNQMYDELNGEDERVAMAPASGYEYFHNAIPGGYIDHVLRVHKFAIVQSSIWVKLGLKIDNFTMEELEFAAIHHDLGKLGLPGLNREHYQYNDSKWHRENQGKIYKSNPNVPNMPVTDKGFLVLSQYQIPLTENEWIGIRCTDGMYEETNKAYLAGFNPETKLRTSLPYILHQADIMAFRFEFERWAESSGAFELSMNSQPLPKLTTSTDSKVKFSEKELDEFLK